PPPPTPPLFPYTTLFRSGRAARTDPPSARLARRRVLRPERAREGTRARFQHLPRLPALRQPVPRIPHAVRSRRQLADDGNRRRRSEEHTSELQSRGHLVC